jgi:HK97 family phage portal protein
VSVLRRALEFRNTLPPPSGYPESPGKWQAGMVWDQWGPSTGTTDQAMRLSAVFACLRLLSEAVATLPLDVFRRRVGQRVPVDPPAYLAFAGRDETGLIDYLSQVMLSLLTDGNAYVATPRDDLGQPQQLVVLDPCRVTVRRPGGMGTALRFEVDSESYDSLDIMHICGMKLPGAVTGLSPIGFARETVGLGLAAQRFGASFFENGALPGAVVEAPAGFTRESADLFAETWNARHGGVGNAQRVGVLTGGAKLTKVSIQPNDAQFLETRQFAVPDICRFYGVPPHLVADASNSTSWGSGLAEQNLAFGQFSLRSWVTRIEAAHNRLLTSDGRRRDFVKLNLDALLRASLKDRYEAYAVGLANGFLVPNEPRTWEDLPPLPGGDAPPAPPVPPPGGAPA